ncbi:MAG: hypothetical protein QG567_1458 [Campylobacterota bacterium]|nr:hypothetical protein [Campylobacterota bacterium]
MSKIHMIILSVLIIFGIQQIIKIEIPIDINAKEEIKTPDEVASILKKSCYDCHSYDTKWPWYSYVAPMSWFVDYHVKNGLFWLNYSRWDNYDDKTKEKLLRATARLIDTTMPNEFYLALHSDAKLSEEQKNIIKNWVESELEKLKTKL